MRRLTKSVKSDCRSQRVSTGLIDFTAYDVQSGLFSAPMIGNMRGVAFLKVVRQIRESGGRKSPVGSGGEVPAGVCGADLDWPLCHCAIAQAPPSTNTGAPFEKKENKKFPKFLNYPKNVVL